MEPGDRVFDTEDDDPNQAIAVRVPAEESIAEWTYTRDDQELSTADENPDYPTDAQLVNVAFESTLTEEWPEWSDAGPANLWNGVREREIPVFGFPEGRLGHLDPPATLEPVIERLEGDVDAMAWHPGEQCLSVEKMGETATITPEGAVEGSDLFADRLAELVENQADKSSYKYQP